jgi:hypothetical protein
MLAVNRPSVDLKAVVDLKAGVRCAGRGFGVLLGLVYAGERTFVETRARVVRAAWRFDLGR